MIWKKRIYADAAAATPLSRRARAELIRLLNIYGNPGGLHKEGVEAKEELEKAREKVAAAIGARSDEIIFTSGGTEGNNLAIGGVLRPLLEVHGELNAITAATEHSSVLEPLRALEREGLYNTELPVDAEGRVDPKALREAITDETALVSIHLVNSEVGTIQPIRDLAKEIRHARKTRSGGVPLYLHCDASQAPLWEVLRVESFGVDLLTLDGQKIGGPKGVGALYVRRGTPLEPLIHGGGQERGLRSGTENVALAGSFAVALADAQASAQSATARTAAARDFLFREIQRRIPDVLLNGPALDERVANNLNISIPGLDGQMATVALSAHGVAVSTRSACDVGEEAPSPVLAALGLPIERMQSAVRLTLLPSATTRDAKRIAQALAAVAQRYKK